MAGDRATADNILRRAGGGVGSSDAAAARAAAAAAQAAAQATALARQAQNPLRRALESIRTFQAAQDAARAAAQAVPGDVPDGIAIGGLEVAPGGTFQGADLLTLTTADGRSEVTLRQSDPRAILTWNTFNVGRNTDVYFDQTGGGDNAPSWVALNRVVDPSAAPSRILGSIRAEGQVYIINRNGILFGGTAQVNVGTLVASGLDILPPPGQTADSRFLTGTLYDLRFVGPAGSLTVEPGARLSSSGQGRIVLLGGQVVNGGSIEAPDGQVILAAGTAAGAAPAITLVPGDLGAVRGLAPPIVSAGGAVENTGIISAPRGNITMVAADTRQDGLLTATTGAQANGSITLGADGFTTSFGVGSVTQILPDAEGVKVIGSGEGFRKSRVEVRGDRIDVLDGATIYAPSGDVLLSATMTAPDPSAAPPSGFDDTQIYVGSEARIDVSGLPDVVVAMEQNDIEAELRANELRDAPLLRDGALRGRTVHFDARLGVRIADLSGYYDLVERDVSQLMTSGGSLTLNANQIVTREGSTIDLSGGNLRYLPGYMQSTVLIDPTGKRVPIEAAVPGVPYVGIDGGFVVNHARWGVTETYASGLSRARPRFEPGYLEGGSAGSLIIGTNQPTWYVQYLNAHAAEPRPPDPSATGAFRIFDGTIVATTIVGPRQRELPTGTTDPTQIWRQQPRGASLTIAGAGDVTIADGGAQLPATYHRGDPVDAASRYRHVLPARWFDGRTFRTVAIDAGYDPDTNNPGFGDPGTIDRAPGGHLAIGPGTIVDLGDGGSFSFKGKGAEIDGTLLAPGGNVSIQTLRTDGGAELPGLRIGATGVVDVAGRMTNDFLDGLYGPMRAVNGGKVSLTGARVVLDAGSLVDVSGGARIDATGAKSTAGNGGSIAIDVSQHPTPTPNGTQAAPFQGTLTLDGALLRGYALGRGGSLSLATGYDVWIGDALPADATSTYRLFTPAFFTQGGFSSYSIVGERSVTVASGTELAPSTGKLVFRGVSASGLRTGTRLDDVLATMVMPDELRDPMSLALSTIPARQTGSDASIQPSTFGDLLVDSGSTIRMTPGSAVRLGSTMDLRVKGTVEAPGGDITLEERRAIYIPAGQEVPGIHLDAGAQLLASGYVRTKLVGIQKVRSVEAGGTITLSTNAEVAIDPSAVLDVSGVHGIADLPSGAPIGSVGTPRYQVSHVDGDAGSVSISAPGGVVDGALRLAPGGPSGRGGSLVVERAASTSGPIVVSQSSPGAIAGSLAISANAIDASGADDVTLRVIGSDPLDFGPFAILFDGSVDLHARRSLTLVSPVLGTRGPSGSPSSVTLSSRYVALVGGTARNPDSVAVGSANLDGTLTVAADLIDVSRTVLLGCATDPLGGCGNGGFAAATFDARGDIRFSDPAARGKAGLFSTGALAFRSAQVYVASRSQGEAILDRPADDPGIVVQSGQRIDVIGNGNPAPVPLSFGERLTLRAPVIDQGGVVRAPQGQIFLVGTGADGSVTLEPGSVTSASLAGLTVPFGKVGTGGVFVGYDAAGEAPTKSINVVAPNVAVMGGAVMDVSGGGDLLGWLAVPGNGGSGDILGDSKGFALLPSLGTAPAPIGGVDALRDSRLRVGDEIYLQGIPGLADGIYTLLPAHYALLPGGLLVQPLGGSFASAPATSIRPDGTVIASGHDTLSGTPGFSRYLVMSHEVFGRYSRIDTYSFNPYAQELAGQAGVGVRTAIDAGAVVLDATQTLLLQGTGRFGASDGRPGDLDLSAPKIAVVGDGAAAPDASYLTLDPHALEAFGAGSVLLGGTRTRSAGGTAIAVRATDVYVATEAASPLRAPELILAAQGSVSIADGSVVRAEGAAPADAAPLLLSGDGALVRLSTGGRVPIVRTGATPAGGAPCTVGCLAIGNATLSVNGSLSLDGSQGIALSPAAALSARQFDLASARVNLGDAPANAPGVTLGADKLAELAAASDLLIRGHDSIDVYGSISIGSRGGSGAATLRALTLDTGLLQGHLAAGDAARITAADLTLRNSGGGGQGTSGAGSLVLDLDALHLGPGQVQVAGLGALTGAAGLVETRGAGSLAFGGDLSLSTGQLRAGAGAHYVVQVGGALALGHGALAAQPAAASILGGRIDVEAASVLLDASVVLPAGVFQATATTGALQLGQNAAIDVRGAAVDFNGQARYAPGGTIRLTASSGHLDVAAGASLDVSGSQRGGDAGAIALVSSDRASVLGHLRGIAAPGFDGGSFALDAGNLASLAELSALNARLEDGGFDRSREIRLRQQGQDIVLGSGDRIHAHHVVLRSDAGQVRVAGEIVAAGTASRPDGGRIRLEGGGGVTVDGTAVLDAHAADAPAGGFDPSSAKVEIVADGGRVDVAPGAVVDVGGGRSGGGSVVVRAPRDGNDVAVDRIGADVRGAREVIVQGVQTYAVGVVDSDLVNGMLADADAWMSGAGSIQARLAGLGAPAGLIVAPGMLVTSGGDLSIQSTISLGSPSGTRGPGYLGFVAESGNILVQAVVSDGFDAATRDASNRLVGNLLPGRSFSYELESGGDIELFANAAIRTGTGDISIRAGHDLKLDDATSVIYTAGARTATPASFLGAPAGMPLGELATGGGDVEIVAGHDVRAPFTAQTTSAWLFRYGATTWNGDAASSTVSRQTSWSIIYPNFEQAVGALGGGDVRVRAGNDVVQLQVSIPTTGFLTTAPNAVPAPGDLAVRGGGDLDLSAGGDIRGGLFMLGRGRAQLRADGSVVPSDTLRGLRTQPVTATLGMPRSVGVLFGLMDATADVTARSAVYVEGAYDPMRQGQIAANLAGGTGSAFWGYSQRAALEATSVAGTVTFENDPWASVDLSLAVGAKPAYQVRMSGSGNDALNIIFSRAPPSLRLTSLQSSVSVEDHFGHFSALNLAPAARGTLELLAGQDVHLALASIGMDDVAPRYARGPLDPFAINSSGQAAFGAASDASSNFQRGFVPTHAGDPDPVRIYALDGSVCGRTSGLCTRDAAQSVFTRVVVPKPIEVIAGQDVVTGLYQPQNNGPNDVSLIMAGRDLFQPVLEVMGEGVAVLQAGRDVVLNQPPRGTSPTSLQGGVIYSLGNRTDLTRLNVNQALPDGKGADLHILAGMANGVDYDAFAAAYLDPAHGHGVVRTYLPELAAYMRGLGYGPLSDADLVAAFQALPLPRRAIFLDQVYFAELKATGIDYNDPSSPRYHSYDRGFSAISLLFPTDPRTLSPSQRGDVILSGRAVETQADAGITIVAPYGSVDVGADGISAAAAALGGVVTRRGGDIRIMSDEDIALYTSRVFTLQGGDITMWTSDGSITAGAASKTSVFQKPLVYTMNAAAVVAVDAFGLQTGGGIGVLDALQNAGDRPRSRLDLVAPRGEVNAGDAGIRVVGDLNIAAQVVVGMENIQVTGASAGVPKVEAPNVGALTTASQVAQAAAKEGVGPDAAAAKNVAADLPSIITVEVVGYETTDKDDGKNDERRKKAPPARR